MKIQTRNILIISSLAVVVYLVFCPERLSLEPGVILDWAQTSAMVSTLPPVRGQDAVVSLYAADSVIFASENGQGANSLPLLEAGSLHGKRLARLNSTDRIVEILDIQAGVIARLPELGAPWFSNGTLAIVGQGASSLTVYTEIGEFRWRLDSPDLITGFVALKNGDSFVSFLGGTISWRDSMGKERLSMRPGSGRIAAIYSLLWIESRQILAVVADLNPQTLLVLTPHHDPKGVASLELLETVTLPRASRHPLWMQSELGDSMIILEQENSIGVLSLDQTVRTIIPLGGRPGRVLGLKNAGVLVCLVQGPQGNSLVAMKPDGRKLFTQFSSARFFDLAKDSREHLVLAADAGLESLSFTVR